MKMNQIRRIADLTFGSVVFGAALLTVTSCSNTARQQDTASISSSSGLVSRLREATTLDVQSITIKEGRVDVEILYDAPIFDADSGHRLFQMTADRIWSLDRKLSGADTIAVATLRASEPPGAIERSTYFYYRVNRSVQAERGRKGETRVP